MIIMPCKRYYEAVKNGQPDNQLCPVDAKLCTHLKPYYPWHLCIKVNGTRTEEQLKDELELLKEQRYTGDWSLNVSEYDEFEKEKEKRGKNNGSVL